MTVGTFTPKFMITSNVRIAMMHINDALLKKTSSGYGCHVNRGWHTEAKVVHWWKSKVLREQ